MSLRPVLGPVRQDRRCTQALVAVSVRPPLYIPYNGEIPQQGRFQGTQSHGIRTRCLRLAGRVAPPPRKTRFRQAGQSFAEAGFVYPQDCDERFSEFRVSFSFLELA